MVKTIDMQTIRHLNLFENVTRVNTRFCLKYDNGIIFCVPKSLVLKAVGRDGENIRKISMITKRRVKIIAKPRGIEDVKYFIGSVISPITFKNIDVRGNEIIITAGGIQNKAALLGRNKQRFLDLQRVVRDFFEKELRIV
ncbi:MAG: hypothetical protein AABW81_01160 [Nanoarchaeota archaeon]